LANLLGLVDPITPRPIIKDGQYPHMARRDAEVWERWIDQHGADYLAVAYDVAVGGIAAGSGDLSDPLVKMYQYQTALKIDAFVIGRDFALVAEVRPWATVSALGAALTYAYLLERAGLDTVVLVPAIICAGMQVDVEWACEKFKIQIFKV